MPYLVGDFLRRFQLDEFPRIKGDDFPSEWGKNQVKLYKRTRREHPDWDKETKRWRPPAEIEAAPPGREKELVSEPITDLTELKDVAQRLAAKLDKEEASE